MRFIKSYFQPPLASKETGNIDDTYWDDDFPDDTRIRDSDLAVLAVLIYVGGIGLLIILSIGIAIDFLFIGTPAIRILGILLLISFSIYKVYTLLRPPK